MTPAHLARVAAAATPTPAADTPAAAGGIQDPAGPYALRVNGEVRQVRGAGAADSLLRVLRDELGLTGAKDACEQGRCGSCSVLLDGTLVASCLVLAADAQDAEVMTVEGLAAAGSGPASSRHSSTTAPCSVASARRASWWRPPPC